MSTLSPVCGVPCVACKEFLTTPVISLDECHHHLHRKCFQEISQQASTCPECNAKFTKGTENPQLEKLITKLDQLARPILQNSYGSSEPFVDRLFHEAIKEGEIDVVASLLAQGVSASTLVQGRTPLYNACKNGKIEVAQLLLENGANPTQKNDLSYQAKLDNYWHINDHEHAHDATPMKAAVETGDKALTSLLVKHGAPFDEPGTDGRSPVFVAVCSGNEDLALFFIKNGANIKVKDHRGITLLSMAVRCGHLNVVRELVKRGADIREQDKNGSTILHNAAGRKNSELLEYLLQTDAKDVINVLWLGIWTPLSSAAEAHNLENVKLLVEAGADLSLKYKGLDILELARKKLSQSESFYGSRPQYQEEGERVVGSRQSIVKFLQEAIGQSHVTPLRQSSPVESKSKAMEIVDLSDGATTVPRVLILQTLVQIKQAAKGAGIGMSFLLADLKNKAEKEDHWEPAPNPFCKSIEIMKTHLLIDGRGHMPSHVKSIVKDCIAGDGFDVRLQIPEHLSNL